MPGMKMPVYISNIKFTEETISELVDKAGSARSALLWARSYGFWLGTGLGIFLTLAGLVIAIRLRRQTLA